MTLGVATRRCPHCKEDKTGDGFHFGATWCKECKKQYDRQRRAAKADELREYDRQRRLLDGDHIREREKRRYHENRDHELEIRKQWRSSRPDLVKAHNKKYYQRYSDAVKARVRDWYAANRDRAAESRRIWAESNRERKAAADREWRARNRDRVRQLARIRSHVRRVRLRLVPRDYTVDDISALLERQKHRCATCRCSVRRRYEVDHVHPLALGGQDILENLQILCQRCNRRKGHKHPDVWANQNGLLF